VNVGEGHKTGFYVDQRVNRRRVAAYAAGRRVLSAYCYTGAFELHAARAGAADILGIDCSQPALDQAQRHHTLNGTTAPVRYERADVPQFLRRCRDSRQTFDMIVLDPPKFVVSRAQKDKGLRAYKDINLMAMKLLERGGVLATFSCSGLVEAADFRQAIEWAAQDSGRNVCIVETLGQPPDHPVLTAFPESEYLKGLVCWVR
jgi:23S rRNA (cytosine1962-C5)-methyltransferase